MLKLTVPQMMLLADLYDSYRGGDGTLFPSEAGEVTVGRSLARKGLAQWEGMYLRITDAGKVWVEADRDA